MQPGHNAKRSHHYVLRGTPAVFASLWIATGKVMGLCQDRLHI